MAKITKREHKKMTKAFNNRLAGGESRLTSTQIQKRRILPKIYLDDDEFTTHSGIKQISTEFIQSAMDLENFYQGGKKKLIVAFAYDLEVELKRLGQDRLVSKISTFIMKLLKQARIKWSPIYLRRCLDNRYKEPINQANALARKKYPGLPQDSGQTVEELEAALQAKNKSVVGEYVVKCELKPVTTYNNALRPIIIERAPDGDEEKIVCTLPLIIRVKAAEQDAAAELDEETYKKMILRDSSKSKSKPKTKTKSNPDTKPIPKTKQPNSPREKKAFQIIKNLEEDLKAAKTGEEANQIAENFKRELDDFLAAKPEAKDPDQ